MASGNASTLELVPEMERLRPMGRLEVVTDETPAPAAADPRPSPLPDDDTIPLPMRRRVEMQAAMLGTFQAIAALLAIRFLLLVALGGGMVLAVMAMASPDLLRLIVLATYCLLVIIPFIWLERSTRRSK